MLAKLLVADSGVVISAGQVACGRQSVAASDGQIACGRQKYGG